MTDQTNQALDELRGQRDFYNRKSIRAKRAYQLSRALTIMLAAAIPVVTVAGDSEVTVALLGSLIVAVEGLQQLFQFHNRWVEYRGAWNALERERRLYQSAAGPYRNTSDPDRLLAERTEAVLASENVEWTNSAGPEAG